MSIEPNLSPPGFSLLHGSIVVLLCAMLLSCGNADPAPVPPEFKELDPAPKTEECYISEAGTRVIGAHGASAKLIAQSPCKHAHGLWIADVPGIRDLWFLEGIETVQADTRIANNTELKSLEGLESLKRTDKLEVIGNDSLETLKGLDGLQFVRPPDDPRYMPIQTPGLVRITDNPSLKSLQGLENLEEANAIVIGNCENLRSVESLYGMKSLAYLEIRNAPVPRCQVDELVSRLENTDVELDLAGLGSGDCS